MYIQIQKLKALGFSKRRTARVLAISRDTVSGYWDMAADEYTAMAELVKKQSSLMKYESVILIWRGGSIFFLVVLAYIITKAISSRQTALIPIVRGKSG